MNVRNKTAQLLSYTSFRRAPTRATVSLWNCKFHAGGRNGVSTESTSTSPARVTGIAPTQNANTAKNCEAWSNVVRLHLPLLQKWHCVQIVKGGKNQWPSVAFGSPSGLSAAARVIVYRDRGKDGKNRREGLKTSSQWEQGRSGNAEAVSCYRQHPGSVQNWTQSPHCGCV